MSVTVTANVDASSSVPVVSGQDKLYLWKYYGSGQSLPNCTQVQGGTSNQLVIPLSMVGKKLAVEVYFTNRYGQTYGSYTVLNNVALL